MRRLRLFVALGVLLWLPLQGIAAVAMPFCRHALNGPQSHAVASAIEHAAHRDHAAHDGHDGHDTHGPSDTGSSLRGNDCGACHLACAPAVAPAAAGTLLAPVASERLIADPSKPRAFIPEQPKPPPLQRG